MIINNECYLAHPRQRVFEVYRDCLSEVTPYLDDIREITVLSREETGSVVTLHNEWVSDREVPAMARKIVRPEHLRWDDFAVWDASTFTCRWRIGARVFSDAITCRGTNQFMEEGQGTRLRLTGDFNVQLKEIPGVPRFMAKRIIPQVEKFIVSLITPNLERTNQAVGRFLDAQR